MYSKEKYIKRFCDKATCAICGKEYPVRKRRTNGGKKAFSIRSINSKTCSKGCALILELKTRKKWKERNRK